MQSEYAHELKQAKQHHAEAELAFEDKIFALMAELDEVKAELVHEAAAAAKGDTFAEAIRSAQKQQQEKELIRMQKASIEQMEGSLKQYHAELANLQCEVKLVTEKSNHLISTHNESVKIVREQIKVYVPTLKQVEREIVLEKYCERAAPNGKAELSEAEQRAIRRSVKEEFRARIKELELNILAY